MTTTSFLLLPQLSMKVTITNNSGWYDQLFFTQAKGSIVPLDLTGLDFHAELRIKELDTNIRLDMTTKTDPPTLINGLTTGMLSWSVPFETIQKLPTAVYTMDIVAIEKSTNRIKNLFETGPALVTVLQGVTR